MTECYIDFVCFISSRIKAFIKIEHGFLFSILHSYPSFHSPNAVEAFEDQIAYTKSPTRASITAIANNFK